MIQLIAEAHGVQENLKSEISTTSNAQHTSANHQETPLPINRPTFMTLPAEIRRRIYWYIIPHFQKPFEVQVYFFHDVHHNLPIYSVCKTIRAELWDPYRTLRVTHNNSPKELLRDIQHLSKYGFHTSLIERLVVTTTQPLRHEATILKTSSTMKWLSLRLTDLERIELRFTVYDEDVGRLRNVVPADWTRGLEQLISKNLKIVDVTQLVVKKPKYPSEVASSLMDLIREDIGNCFYKVRGAHSN